MFKKIKYFVSSVFSTDSNAKFPPPPPPPPKEKCFYVLKNIFRSRKKNITPPLKVKRYSCLRKMLQKLE